MRDSAWPANTRELGAALRRFAPSQLPTSGRERGGIVLWIAGSLGFQELPNRAASDRRYVALVPAIGSLPGELIGFWHTHPGAAIPGHTDLRELLRINQRFGRSFAVCIVGERACSVTRIGALHCLDSSITEHRAQPEAERQARGRGRLSGA